MRNLVLRLLSTCMLVWPATVSVAAGDAADESARIRPWSENAFYWQYKGRPILLLGGSDEDNLFNHPDLMRANFDTLAACGGNYIRCTLSCRDEGNVWPFAKVDGKYDLERFDPEYWRRLESCLREAEKRDIIVQIEFWATFDYYRDFWEQNPFNPANNINYTTENTRLEPTWPHHPARRPQPFVFSVPERNNDRLVLQYQQRFVREVLRLSHAFPNVLYCLDNETRAPVEWAWYWGEFVHAEAKRLGVTVYLTEMWDPWDLGDEAHARTYERPEWFAFTDVSQNNWQIGQTHYDRLMAYRQRLLHQSAGARPMNNVKVYQRQGGGGPNDAAINLDRWWQNVFAGCASTRFHRPPGGIGLNAAAQRAIRAARVFTSEFDVFQSQPRLDVFDDRDPNEAYCLSADARVFALYFPSGGHVSVRVGDRSETRSVRWFDPESAAFRDAENAVVRDGSVRLESPNQNQSWLALVE